MKKIILIVLGIVFVAILGRFVWAYFQVKADEVKANNIQVQVNTESNPVVSGNTVQPLPGTYDETGFGSAGGVGGALPTPQDAFVVTVGSPTTTTKTSVVKDTSTQNGITMGVAIKAPVTTTTSCGTAGCFQQKFAACQPATLNADAGFASVNYKIIVPLDSQHCRMMFKYTKSPNPDWTNKEMTCTYQSNLTYSDNPNSYEVQMGNMFTSVLTGSGGDDYDACEGPLYSLLQPEKAAARAARQIPSKIKIGELNYSTIPFTKLNDYVGKQVAFKVLNTEPEMKFCLGSIRTRKDGDVQASDEIIAHKCSVSPLVYSSANKMVSMPAFTAKDITGIVNEFTDRGTGVAVSLILEFYAVDKDNRESNHLKLTITQ